MKNKFKYIFCLHLLFILNLAHAILERTPLNISEAEIAKEIQLRLKNVPELKRIKEISESLFPGKNYKIYLFGGAAAAFANYVYLDLAREQGNTKISQSFLNYDLTNIFQSSQDIDLVLDGPPEAADLLKNKLSKELPFYQNNKSAWEVRPLNDSLHTYDALRGPKSFDFSAQHSDSYSNGLIEIVNPDTKEKDKKVGEIRDLRDFDNTENLEFLKSVKTRELKYFFSEKHQETLRYKQQKNPPIFSVIRYLIKLFQYNLQMNEETKSKLKKIIAEFNFDSTINQGNDFVKTWIETYGIKLMTNATDVEYAREILDELGLRQKLMNGPNKNEYRLHWWMNKEPLRSRKLGAKKGRTAADLKITKINHQTRNLDSFSIMTSSPDLSGNFFISRGGQDIKSNENAAFGDGFYTSLDDHSFYGNGNLFKINLMLKPEATEGKDNTYDFTLIQDDEDDPKIVIIHNKNAISIIPEESDITFEQLISIIENNETQNFTNLAIYEKIMRKLHNKFQLLDIKTKAKIKDKALTLFNNELGPRFQSDEIIKTNEMKVKVVSDLLKITSSATSLDEIVNLFYDKDNNKFRYKDIYFIYQQLKKHLNSLKMDEKYLPLLKNLYFSMVRNEKDYYFNYLSDESTIKSQAINDIVGALYSGNFSLAKNDSFDFLLKLIS